MKLLILSFYYPPDLSAGSFRTAALVEALGALKREGLEVEVITTQPNRYRNMAGGAPLFEDHGWLRIRRIPLPSHRSGALDQVRAFSAFVPAVLRESRGQWDAVFATSSRLMTAALGAEVARRTRAPLYLDIRDLFSDTMGDLLSGSPLGLLLPVFRYIEKRTLGRAARVNLVSEGFLTHARSVAPGHDYRLFTNGIDDSFLEGYFRRAGPPGGAPLILYAGNIGDGQGLHRILPEAAQRLGPKVRFRVIGDGGRRKQLEDGLSQADVGNVEMMSPIPRKALNEHYREADILFLHLNDHAAFLKVLPSKIFEYAATGKPMLAGVSGYAAEFLRREVPGVAVFDPCDAAGMADAVEELLAMPAVVDRASFRSRYARSAIMGRLAADLVDLAA